MCDTPFLPTTCPWDNMAPQIITTACTLTTVHRTSHMPLKSPCPKHCLDSHHSASTVLPPSVVILFKRLQEPRLNRPQLQVQEAGRTHCSAYPFLEAQLRQQGSYVVTGQATASLTPDAQPATLRHIAPIMRAAILQVRTSRRSNACSRTKCPAVTLLCWPGLKHGIPPRLH
jgi:hypothetical protein